MCFGFLLPSLLDCTWNPYYEHKSLFVIPLLKHLHVISSFQDAVHTPQSGVYCPSKAYLLSLISCHFWLQQHLGLCIWTFPFATIWKSQSNCLSFMSLCLPNSFSLSRTSPRWHFFKNPPPFPQLWSRYHSCASTAFWCLFQDHTCFILLLPVYYSPPDSELWEKGMSLLPIVL